MSVKAKSAGFVRHLLLATATLSVALAGAEALVRFRNAGQQNYYVEMWRYAKELKQRAVNPDIGHVHIPNRAARLQNVDISINSWGMRGPEPADRGGKRILLLGSSITLGWGVAEEQTLRARLEQALDGRAQVFNGGIGNYNAVRYVTLFEERLAALKPDVVVVQYFLRDAEDLAPAVSNPLLENSLLAALGYHAIVNALEGGRGEMDSLVRHYRQVYDPASRGRQRMEQALARLAQLGRERGFQVVMAITPDIHRLEGYPFADIHEQVGRLAAAQGWRVVDLTPALATVPPKDLYAIPGDPHPNGLGHRLMAEALVPALREALDAVP